MVGSTQSQIDKRYTVPETIKLNSLIVTITMNIQRLSLLALVPVLFFACKGTEKEIEVESIAVSQPSAEMEIGETLALKATVSPSNATYDGMTWTSTKPKVASVTEEGLVSALSEGNTTITVMVSGKTASCVVTVVKGFVAVTSIKLDKASLEMVEGDTETLSASVLPDDATDKTVTWTSSEKGVATVKDGVVSAISPGTATITAKAGDVTATCKVTVQKRIIAVESIELNKAELSLVEGESETLKATVKPDNATDKTLSWTSSDSSIAVVDNNGKVTAVKEGETTVTATAGERTASCKVVVQKKVIPVTSISINQDAIELYAGESQTLTAFVKPDNATEKTVTWKSSNSAIAKVEDGKVTALAVGETTVSAAAGDKTATCKVTVKQRPHVSSLTLSESSFNGYINKYYSINATVVPSDAQYDLEWSSSNTRVAVVEGSGLSRDIHTKDFGTTDITVKDKISGKTASVTVRTVVTDFEWKENTGSTYAGYPLVTIDEGEEYQLHYSCSPSSATHVFEDLSNLVFYEPTYVVDSPSVISISSEGIVKGLKAGTIGIKPTGRIIKGSSGNDRVYIAVKSKTVAVSEVRLDKTTVSLSVGSSITLTATVLPENASNKTVSWKSSNTSVATVDSNGKVKAIAGGSATITATAGGVSAKCSVTVSVPVTSVSLNKTSLNLMVGDTETLSATIYPSDATNKNVTWKSSNTSVATVQSGKVSAVGVGTAQITVTTNNGSKKATCTVTVTPKGDPGPKGYKVFIKHGGEFKYDDIPGWGTYQGKSFTSPNTKYNYSGDNHELNVTASSTEVSNMLKGLGMTEEQFRYNYNLDDPMIIVKKNSSGTYAEPGDIADEGGYTNLGMVSYGDLNYIYGYGLTLKKLTPSSWTEFSFGTSLFLDSSVSIGGPHFVYVVFPALDNTKNVDVVVKFVYNVTR